MNTHTPGPWKVNDYRSDQARIVITNADDTANVATVFRLPDSSTAKANVRLIAAAPDLLAALQAFVRATNDSRDSVLNELNREARTAIFPFQPVCGCCT